MKFPILLVAPYDRYASIDRFVACLERELAPRLPVRVLRPQPLLARFSRGAATKWFGYADKFIVFPRILARESAKSALVHLCDQSTAIYTRQLRGVPHVLNCNDLIAVRDALGEFPRQRVGWPGRCLQRAILRGIKSAHRIVCLSEAARSDVLRLGGVSSKVIPMGLHYSFERIEPNEAKRIIHPFIPDQPFLLHVGGNQWYKNRAGVLEIYRELVAASQNPPHLVLVGEPLTPEARAFVREHRLENQVFVVSAAGDAELRAFYSRAEALLFPSLCEGFGWPILEAQACGCPVVTTEQAPMTEVGGAAAVYIAPANSAASAVSVMKLLRENRVEADARRQAGFLNVRRFSTEAMIDAYARLYSQMTAPAQTAKCSNPAFA